MPDEDAYTLFMRGGLLLRQGHPHQAAVVLERASRLEPGKASIREALARAFFNSGQVARAKEEFAVVLEKEPANHYAHFGLGLCEARAGDLPAARAHLKLAVAMRPYYDAYTDALNKLA